MRGPDGGGRSGAGRTAGWLCCGLVAAARAENAWVRSGSPGQPRGRLHVLTAHRLCSAALPRRSAHARPRQVGRVAATPDFGTGVRVERLASGAGRAFLAGRWTERALTDRGRAVTGPGQPWLRPVVREVLRAYPSAPADRPRELAALARGAPAGRGRSLPAPRRWYAAPTRMGPVPAAGAGPGHGRVAGRAARPDRRRAGLVRGRARAAAAGGRCRRLQHYRRRWLARPGGGVRLLEVPRPRLRALQRRILDEVLAALPPSPWAYGFVPGRSAPAGAPRHAGLARAGLAGPGRVLRLGRPRPGCTACSGRPATPSRWPGGWPG